MNVISKSRPTNDKVRQSQEPLPELADYKSET